MRGSFQTDFREGIKINWALLVFPAGDDALPAFKIDVEKIQIRQFAHAHSSGEKHVDHALIAQMSTAISHLFPGLVGIGFLDEFVGADFVNSSD